MRSTILKDFVEFEGAGKFSNVTNGSAYPFVTFLASYSTSRPVTPRRWLDQCNPGLSNLIQEALGIPKAEFLKDLYKLEGLLKYVDNTSFQKKWAAVKQSNKERLANYVENTLGYKVNTQAMFDVQIKRLHEYKRQTMNIFGVIHVGVSWTMEKR